MQESHIKQTPVLLLTGYLGSGKTTLLNRILANERGIRFAVIVNDIGEVNIDADLIEKGGIVGGDDESLVALQNGCICCTLKMDLVKQLGDIIAMHQFDYIVIEASGICEPEPIAQTLATYPQYLGQEALKEGFARLDAIVTVVDALRMRDEFGLGDDLRGAHGEEDLASLVIQQIEFCNIVLLNKASEVSADDLAHVTAIVRELQPKAQIIPCDYGEVDLNLLLNTNLFDFNSVAGSARWVELLEDHEDHEHDHDEDAEDEHEHGHHHHHHGHDHDEDAEDEHEHGHHHHHHHHHHHDGEGEALEYGIETFVYQRHRPMDLMKFDTFVSQRWPAAVIRVKGLAFFQDQPDICFLFEQAGRQFDLKNAGQWFATMPADELRAFQAQHPEILKDWDAKYGDRMQKLVFIGHGMDREAIEAELDACLL